MLILQTEPLQEMGQLLDNAPPVVVQVECVSQMATVMYADLYQEPMKDVILHHHLLFVMQILQLLEVKILSMVQKLDNAFRVRRLVSVFLLQYWIIDYVCYSNLFVDKVSTCQILLCSCYRRNNCRRWVNSWTMPHQ